MTNKVAYAYGHIQALAELGIKVAAPAAPAKPTMDSFGTAPVGQTSAPFGTSRPFSGAQPGAPPQLADVPRAAPATMGGPSMASAMPAPMPPIGQTQAVGTTALMDPLQAATASAGGMPAGMTSPTGGAPSMASPKAGKGR
jgi:hypothetical protein